MPMPCVLVVNIGLNIRSSAPYSSGEKIPDHMEYARGDAELRELHCSTTTRSARPPPQKPSIAVLPFASMSGDAEQEYFSEGITEDIITNLSRYHAFFVLSRSTSFT